ncbi:hypothetical protein FMUND_11939 [Fusarium mundagurra]|uniref:Uncharacterized protein n=1 Tax=Fusarium mundagurra TaxID=1567541 RepID=A0A8H5Y6B1_9HYPO|nr:hypothetical protein FMUND_11939 [Fusarium mundagurra]
MASRHVHTQRLMSGVIFSAPGNVLAMPEGGWGDDTPMRGSKKRKTKIANRGIEQFPRWMANMALHGEAYNNLSSFAPTRDAHFMDSKYRPSPIPQYPEPSKRLGEPEVSEVTLCLPVLSVSLTATVEGTVSHTELVQKFHNTSDVIIDAAKHVFPLYDGAVITSFECTIGDERRVRGIVKPKVQARKEFEEAVRDKVAAPALLEEHTPEIFETSLGNIPANTTVEIKITYVQELKVVMMESEATEGIALTIPMSIAPRYSKRPIEWEPASKLPEERLDIWIKVLDNGEVNYEGCDEESGHLLQFERSKPVEYSNFSERDAEPKTYYVWHHESELPVLRKDFVFIIQMNEGHHIKSRAMACPADDNGLAAMMVRIRPNDLFRDAIIPQSFTGEILFLLDQSGSMQLANGSTDYGRRHTGARKVDVMREAMLLALSGIPSTCVFNVISWGSATVGLWETSRPHTQENIREAKSYVSQVEADMGGTDLLRALESVVKRRVQDKESTQIIILTDGELEPEESIQFIWKKRQLFGDSIRFFALGIGDEVSHRLVESIAECGGGYSDVVHTTQTPRWHDRLNRLLKSALEPNSWSCDIELGSGFERKSLVDYKLEQQTTAETDKTPYVQGPFPISSLHPFSFASISFLIDIRHGGELPKTITISTTTPGAKKKAHELPIEAVSGNDGTIHRLVAKSVLLDLQDEIQRGKAETHIANTNAETIGNMYSITSKWTSFVAISENQATQTVEEKKMNHYKALFDEIDIDELLNDESSSSGVPTGGGTCTPTGREQMSGMSRGYPLIARNPLTSVPFSKSAREISIPASRRTLGLPSMRAAMSAKPNFADNNASVYLERCGFSEQGISPNDILDCKMRSIHTQPNDPDIKAEPSGNKILYARRGNFLTRIMRPILHFRRWRYSKGSNESTNQTNPTPDVRAQTSDLEAHAQVGTRARASNPSYSLPFRQEVRRKLPPLGKRAAVCNSDYDGGRQSSLDLPSTPPKAYGPLDWQFAMECQDGQGLFDLGEKRPSLHLHFCLETVAKFIPKISELLHMSTTPEEERDDISARLLDTLMMIEFYKTHQAQEEDTWDLMMERAWDAVISALGLSDEEEALEELAGEMRGAMMHAHYVAATGVKDSQKGGGSVETVRCPACDVVWLTTRKFFCPFDHESDEADEFMNWDEFWKHQVNEGHVVCAQEVMN